MSVSTNTSKRLPLSRRTVLRGLGTAMALPLLESMLPRTACGAASAGKPPVRMAFLFVPNGINMSQWTIDQEGGLGELSPTLQPLGDVKPDLLLLSGLALHGGQALGDGAGDHARCLASFLTGAHPKKTHGKDIQNDVSVDQVAAAKIGRLTRFPSLELGCDPSAQGGNCDSGYSCIYSSDMSWRTATSPMTKQVDPRAVFDRLFGNDLTGQERASRAKRDQTNKSILDFVRQDAKDLERTLGGSDRRKLEEYLYAVRQIERRIEHSEKWAQHDVEVPDYPRPAGLPKDYDQHIRLMMDMMVLAMVTDSTRILTFMYANAGSNRSYQQIGVPEAHHQLSHHGNDPEKLAKIAKIDRHHVAHLAYFLSKLKKTAEGDGSLLDHSMILYGSGLGDGNSHNHMDLPILLAGRGGGTIKTGRHLHFEKDTPMTNLYVSMLARAGAATEKFGDSTSPLEGLEG